MDNNQKALSHFGVPGMRWGVRRAEKRTALANKLSKKYGVKVGEGIKEKEVKRALANASKTKDFLRDDVINTYANNSTSYFADINGMSKMSEKKYNNLVSKTNKLLKEIDNMKVSELKVETSELGKRVIQAKLVP